MLWITMIAAFALFFQLDPGSIFAPGVHVVKETVFTKLITDDEKREIQVVIDGETRVYPYADEFVEVWSIGVDADQVALVAVLDDEYYATMARYTLDLETGEYSYFEPCPGTIMRGDGGGPADPYPSFLDGEIVFALNPESETAHLCWPETGELSDPLPLNTIGAPLGWMNISDATSGEWLLLTAGTNNGGRYDFYGYELATGKVISLGLIGGQSFLGGFSGWLNDDEFAFAMTTSVDGRAGIYKANVTVRGSLERVALEGTVTPGGMEQLYNTEHCSIELTDMDTLETRTHRLGTHCDTIYRAENGVYLALVREDDAPAKLVKLEAPDDAITLYEGEIDFLGGISPDGRYAVVISGEEVIFWDTVANSAVYTAPYSGWPVHPAPDRVLEPGRGFTNGVVWLPDDAALLPLDSEGAYEVILFGQNVKAISVNHVHKTYPGNLHLILQEGDPEDASTYQVFDILNQTTTPLFADDFPSDQYLVDLFGYDDLRVELTLADTGERYALYHVTFD